MRMKVSAAVLAVLAVTSAQPLGEVIECGEDFFVHDHACVPCGAGERNRGGDDPTGPNTACDGYTVCASHEYAVKVDGALTCRECPAGTAVQAPGDNLVNVALGFTIPCQEFSCTRPVATAGYDLSSMQETELTATRFSASGLRCDLGHAGANPAATTCSETMAHRASAYTLSGCAKCGVGEYSDMPGLRSCKTCHACANHVEKEKSHCTATADRTCECAEGYQGEPSSSVSKMSGCRAIVDEPTPLVPESTRVPLDAYNLGTLMAHCQLWVRENQASIAVFNQHMASGLPDTPGFASCPAYCAHFVSRRESTVCHGLCDVAGQTDFLDGLADVSVGEFAMCKSVFKNVKRLPANKPLPPKPEPQPTNGTQSDNATQPDNATTLVRLLL